MSFISQLRYHGSRDGVEAVVSDGLSLSWSELMERVEAAAASLSSVGVEPGVTVGLYIVDEVEHFIASLALLVAGAWQITLASHDTEQERAAIAERARVAVVFTGTSGYPVESTVRHLRWLPPRSRGAASLDPEGGVLLRTSGTTGSMNIVPLSGSDLLVQAARNPEYAGGRLFRPASMEHNNSKRHRLYCAAMGGTNVFRPDGAFDVATYCVNHKVTTLDLALVQAIDLAAQKQTGIEGVDVRVSGSPVPPQVRALIERNVTRRLYVRYGSTESGTVAYAGPGHHDVAESVGRIVPGIHLEIVDGDTNPVAAGEPGHIRLRGQGLAVGYFEGTEQTAQRFREGWFWPGDIGVLREDGLLRVLGRADDMINLNGINIFPSEIERVLEEHPDVRSAAAMPMSSQYHGQIPVAAVELHTGGVVTERGLMAYARQRLALRAPRRIVIMEELPRNSQGKVLRRQIATSFMPKRGKTND